MTTPQDEHSSSGWTPDDRTFGARLALVRQRMRWGNVKEAAAECGLPTESWRSWERDGRSPRNIVEIAQVIADKTGCDYLWLLTGESMAAREGRVVVFADGTRRQTTGPYSLLAKRPHPFGHQKRTLPIPGTRRPVRLSQVNA